MSMHKSGKRKSALGLRRAKRRRRIAALLAVVTAGGLTVMTTGSQAEATPTTALQAVQVKLGNDGSIRSITSQMVSKSSGSSLTSSTEGLDPATLGGQLPLRVLVSYQYGNRQGTNLSDLAGKSGRFVINMTVQNTSVHPQVDTVNGRQSYALAGTPLTVVATADTGSGNLAQVITGATAPADGLPAGSPVTSGVLSTGANGHAQVQYSALLVPPVLPASTTFTLVETSDKFVVPTFTIAAQPGVVANPSGSGLLQQAFGSSQSAQTARLQALSLIGDVSTNLESVLSTLATMNSQLASGSQNLAGPTLDSLRTSTSALQAQFSALVQQLSTTSSCLQGTVNDTIGDPSKATPLVDCKGAQLPKNVQTQIAGAVKDLQTMILGPSATGSGLATGLSDAVQPDQFYLLGNSTPLSQLVPSTAPDACSSQVTATTVAPNPSLLGQVQALSGWFAALSQGSQLCSAVLQKNIVDTLGGITTQINTVASTLQSNLTTLTDSLTAQINNVLPSNDLISLYNDVVTLQQAINNLSGGTIKAAEINKLTDAVTAITSALSPAITDLQTVAGQQIASIGALTTGASGSPAPADQLVGAIQTICATPSDSPDPSQTALSNYLQNVGSACSPASRTPLSQQASVIRSALQNDLAAWNQVQGDANNLNTAITDANGVVAQLQADISNLKVSGLGLLSDLVNQLIGGLGGIQPSVDPTATSIPSETCPATPSGASAGSIAKVFDDFAVLYCNNQTLSGRLSDAIASFSASASPLPGTLQTAGTNVTSLGSGAAAGVGSFLRDFATALAAAQTSSTTQLGSAATTLSQALGLRGSAIQSQLSSAGGSLALQIATVFNQAVNGSGTKGAPGINAASKQLGADELALEKALVGKGGLLSVLDANNGNAQQAHRLVGSQVSDSAQFTAIQNLSSAQSQVTQNILQQSLSSELGAFGVTVPAGSRITPVFTFELGNN